MADTLAEWSAAACRALQLDPAEIGAHRRLLLELARTVAHEVERPAAPLSTFLLGLAVGRGADLAGAANTLDELAKSWAPGTGEETGPVATPPEPTG